MKHLSNHTPGWVAKEDEDSGENEAERDEGKGSFQREGNIQCVFRVGLMIARFFFFFNFFHFYIFSFQEHYLMLYI